MITVRSSIKARVASLALLLGSLAACPASAPPATLPPAPDVVVYVDGAPFPLDDVLRKSPLTVLVFFASDCPVDKAHDARLRELAARYERAGISFILALSQDVKPAGEAEAAKRRGLNFRVIEDHDARLAESLGVQSSNHVVLLRKDLRVIYSGALDADRSTLTSSPELHLKTAIESTLAGEPVRMPRVDALGCPLKKH